MSLPRVFFDITIGGAKAGRIVMEVRARDERSEGARARCNALFRDDFALELRELRIGTHADVVRALLGR